MGWLGNYYGNRAPTGKDRLHAILRAEQLLEETEHGKLIDAVLIGTTVYGAYYNKKLDIIYAIVLLSRFEDNGYLMVKLMDETCGPCYLDCPRKILKQLSPLTPESDPNGVAANWRAECEAKIQKKIVDELSKLPLYTKIRLHDPQKTMLIIKKDSNGRRCYRGQCCQASAKCVRSWGFDVVNENMEEE